ncbi:MAG: cytochrome d ubiquinol oxidase subunit II, partial [Microcella pacifica]
PWYASTSGIENTANQVMICRVYAELDAFSIVRLKAGSVVDGMTIALAVGTILAAMYPNVMPSTTDPAFSLTIENASSSAYTLQIMTWLAVFSMPLVLAYQGWTYWVFRKRLTRDLIPADAH